MIEVTPKATLTIADYCQDKEKRPIRVFLKIGGCGMQSLGLALEAVQPSDELYEIDGHSKNRS
jgi:Fe-S cluster assembly iron-binding protein IscA